MSIAVLDHDNGGINEYPNRKRQSTKGHDVGTDVKEIHGNERRDDRNGQSEDWNQRRTKMEQESDRHEADDNDFFEQIALQGRDGRLNQAGPVVTGNDLDACGQRSFDFHELFVYPVDYPERVHAVTHNNDAAHRFAFSVPFDYTPANIGAEGH